MRKHLLAMAVILTVATGCDNVAWGGIDVTLKSPPPSSRNRTAAPEVGEDSTSANVDGPILLAGVREGTRADFVVVGEVHPEALRVFPDPDFPEDVDRLSRITAPGSEWILFSEGVRVGRMVVDETRQASEFCGSPTTLSGVVELVSPAAAAERLLALPTGSAAEHPYEDYRSISHVYDQRVATPRGSRSQPRSWFRTSSTSRLLARGRIPCSSSGDRREPSTRNPMSRTGRSRPKAKVRPGISTTWIGTEMAPTRSYSMCSGPIVDGSPR